MKLPDDYSTTIDELLNASNSESIFLSSWDRCISNDDIPLEIIKKSVNIPVAAINKYQYMDEMDEIKECICNTLHSKENVAITSNRIAVATNGTASAYLVLRMLTHRQRLRPLLLTPIYFSYISALKDFCEIIEYYQILDGGNLCINYSDIENIIQNNHINLIILNDPIFGCGLSISNDTYKQIISLCERYGIVCMIDYVYGGMEWNIERHYTSRYLLEQIADGKNIILIDSLPKRLYINGIKSAIIYANPVFIKEVEKSSVYTVGCMASPQITLMRELYNPVNKNVIDRIVDNNILCAKNNYNLLSSLTIGTKCHIQKCDSGSFALCEIPTNLFGSKTPMNIAQLILRQCNVITIPHDRYLYFDSMHYCFRINLLSPKSKLIEGINRITRLFS